MLSREQIERVKELLIENPYALKFIDNEEIKNNLEIIIHAVKNNKYKNARTVDSTVLQYAGQKAKNDPEIVKEAVKYNGLELSNASEEIKNDDLEIIMEAVKEYGPALEYSGEKGRNTKEIVMEAIKNCPETETVLNFASEDIRDNPEVVMKAVKHNGFELEHASQHIRDNDIAIVLEAIKNCPKKIKKNILQYVGINLRNNLEIAREALKKSILEWIHVGEKAKNNPEIVMDAVKKSWGNEYTSFEVLCYATPKFKNDFQTVKVAVMRNGLELKYASEELRHDKRILVTALMSNYKNWEPAESYDEGYGIEAYRYCIFDCFPEDVLENKQLMEEIKNEAKTKYEILKKLKETRTVITHFGDDLDNKASIYALERFAIENEIIGEDEHLTVERVPAGKVKEGYLNVDTGGHKGSRFDYDTLVIDGNPQEGIHSAAAELAQIGIYVPQQIVELADTVPNKVNPLESRTALSLIRNASGEQIYIIAEAGLLDKALTDEQLEEYGLVETQKQQQQIIDNAVEKVKKYTIELVTGEKIVLASEQILAGAQIAYEVGVNYYASVQGHKSGKGSTFAVTSKPGIELPDFLKQFGQELVEKYKNPDGTSGVFLNPNGQMLVAGGPKNPDFAVDYEPEELIEVLRKQLKEYEISKAKDKTVQEIVEGIEPTKTGMDKVVDEMLVAQIEKNETKQDEKPGEEPGDN